MNNQINQDIAKFEASESCRATSIFSIVSARTFAIVFFISAAVMVASRLM